MYSKPRYKPTFNFIQAHTISYTQSFVTSQNPTSFTRSLSFVVIYFCNLFPRKTSVTFWPHAGLVLSGAIFTLSAFFTPILLL